MDTGARRENRDRLRFGSGAVYDSPLTFWAAMVVMPIAASALMSSFICGDNLCASVAVKLRASALRVAFAFRAGGGWIVHLFSWQAAEKVRWHAKEDHRG